MLINKVTVAQLIINLFGLLILSIIYVPITYCDTDSILAVGTLSSCNSTVTAKALIVTSYKDLHEEVGGYIVIAREIDSRWDSALASSAGIITEKGGDNNYALSLASRLKIPVIVGAVNAIENITNGSVITMDCSTKKVYIVNNRAALKPLLLQDTYGCIIESNTSSQFDNEYTEFPRVIENVQQHKKVNSTLEKLRSDTTTIKKYIIGKVAKDIGKAKTFGKTAAYWFAGISSYAYDSIPFEFFTNYNEIEKVFTRLEEGVDYIQRTKEDFKKTVHKSSSKIDESMLAKFLYGSIVDKVTVKDNERKILRDEPIKMDEFVKKGIVSREEYMYYTLLNFVTRYYLEEELNKK